MTRRTRIMTTTTAAALLGLAGHTVAAQAATTPLGSADGVRYKTSSALLPSDGSAPPNAGATAGCDEGWKAVAGGQTIGSKPGLGISDSWVGQDKYWYAEAWHHADVATRLRTFAICMKNPELSTSTVVSPELSASSNPTADVICKEGSAVSGGVMTVGDDASHFSLNASFPIDTTADADTVPDNGWRSYVDYAGPGGDTVHFSGTCLAGWALTYTKATISVPAKTALSTKATCPSGSIAVGGGVHVPGETELSHVIASRPWDGKDRNKAPEDGWRAGVRNEAPHSLSITVHAVCRDGAFPQP